MIDGTQYGMQVNIENPNDVTISQNSVIKLENISFKVYFSNGILIINRVKI